VPPQSLHLRMLKKPASDVLSRESASTYPAGKERVWRAWGGRVKMVRLGALALAALLPGFLSSLEIF
ncbi:MAG: hypothetical protein ACREJU_18460, partial [Nitrospiraceae bacterium]